MVLWNGTGGGKLPSMARVERQAGAYRVLWLPAVVCVQSDGNGACETAVRVSCWCDGQGIQGYAYSSVGA